MTRLSGKEENFTAKTAFLCRPKHPADLQAQDWKNIGPYLLLKYGT